MAIFILKLPTEEGAGSRNNSTKAMLVEADNAADSRLMASAQDEQDNDWSGATSVDTTTLSALDYLGYVYRIRVSGSELADGSADLHDVSYTGVVSDTVDLIGAALETALDTSGLTSAYVSGVKTLEVASIGDGFGDHTLLVTVTPPNAARPLSALVGAIVDQGIAAAALSVVLQDPTAIPIVMEKL